MDKEMRWKIWKIVIAIVSIVGVANIVDAVYETLGTNLHIEAVGIDSSEYAGEDCANWTHDYLILGVTYDDGILVTADGLISDVYLTVEFEKPDIRCKDVLLRYWNGTAWSGAPFEVQPGLLTYTLPETRFAVDTDKSVLVPIQVTFMSVGNYTSRIWASGVV